MPVEIEVFVAFGLGIVSAIFVNLAVDRYYRPQIKIENEETERMIHLTDDSGTKVPFIAHRIVVKNCGKTAAEWCKAYTIISENDVERAAWIRPSDHLVYAATLNVNDIEYLDLYAITEDGQICVIPLEYGYSKGTISSCRKVDPSVDGIPVRITSKNAKPSEKIIKLNGIKNEDRKLTVARHIDDREDRSNAIHN
jgi:hypothetical protein